MQDLSFINKKISLSLGLGITQTNNDMEQVIKVTKFLEIKRILLKEATKKILDH